MSCHIIETKLKKVKRICCNIPVKLYFGNLEKKTLYTIKELKEEEVLDFKDYFSQLVEKMQRFDKENDTLDVVEKFEKMTYKLLLLQQSGFEKNEKTGKNEKIDLLKAYINDNAINKDLELDVIFLSKNDGILYYKFDETKFTKDNIKFQIE